jgi:hypothetical protein
MITFFIGFIEQKYTLLNRVSQGTCLADERQPFLRVPVFRELAFFPKD